MSPYEELLQAAGTLGFQVPATNSNGSQQATNHIQQAQEWVQHAQAVDGIELQLSALSDHMASLDATDRALLAARTAAMSSTADTLRLVCAAKDALADRLRSASMKASVPVAPDYQPDFSQMLQVAASNAAVLHQGMQAVQWAAVLDARPSCWEDQLRIIRESAASIKDCVSSMQEFETALVRTATSSAGAGGTADGAVGAMNASSAAAVHPGSSLHGL